MMPLNNSFLVITAVVIVNLYKYVLLKKQGPAGTCLGFLYGDRNDIFRCCFHRNAKANFSFRGQSHEKNDWRKNK